MAYTLKAQNKKGVAPSSKPNMKAPGEQHKVAGTTGSNSRGKNKKGK
jgi:hypothetical protein